MNLLIPALLIASALVGLDVTAAAAGPCTKKIAQFEQAVRQSAKSPEAGPTGRQTIGAQLGRQPTRSSVKQAEAGAQNKFEEALGRAKALDAQGKRGCMQALTEAKSLFELE